MVNARQYERELQNRRRYTPPPALNGSSVQRLLAASRRQVRHRATAERAWRRLAPEEWAEAAWVDAVRDDCVVLATADRALVRDLRRRAVQLARQFSQLMRGVREVRIELHASGA